MQIYVERLIRILYILYLKVLYFVISVAETEPHHFRGAGILTRRAFGCGLFHGLLRWFLYIRHIGQELTVVYLV
jgi:hypothetical protein